MPDPDGEVGVGARDAAAAVSDHELLRRTAGGDRAAFDVLVRRHQVRVLALAHRFLGGQGAAEDVGQEAFLRVFRNAGSFSPKAQFTTWLYRIVANLCWDARRRAARERLLLVAAARARSESDEPASPADAAETVRQAVGELPDRQRLVLILHRFDGLGHHEIADITGWSIGAVESCLVRAYATLRGRLAHLAGSDPASSPKGAGRVTRTTE
ncbi:MAG: RNA polymerase sigma factor [Phycisphaerae bacterium]